MDSRPKILLVEENPLLRWWMQGSLLREGFWVVAPSNPDEATRLAGVFAFDVLICNWRLSDGRDGSEILLAARSVNPEVFAVLISADANSELIEHARLAGFRQVIRKPFPLTAIFSALEMRGLHPAQAATR